MYGLLVHICLLWRAWEMPRNCKCYVLICFLEGLKHIGRPCCVPLQAFARLSAVYGGTYMLSKPDAQVAYENGVAVGVTADGETAKAKLVVGDPSYFPDRVRKTSRVSVALQ